MKCQHIKCISPRTVQRPSLAKLDMSLGWIVMGASLIAFYAGITKGLGETSS